MDDSYTSFAAADKDPRSVEPIAWDPVNKKWEPVSRKLNLLADNGGPAGAINSNIKGE